MLLEIDRASPHPVAFRGSEYIRVGTNKKKLKELGSRHQLVYARNGEGSHG